MNDDQTSEEYKQIIDDLRLRSTERFLKEIQKQRNQEIKRIERFTLLTGMTTICFLVWFIWRCSTGS